MVDFTTERLKQLNIASLVVVQVFIIIVFIVYYISGVDMALQIILIFQVILNIYYLVGTEANQTFILKYRYITVYALGLVVSLLAFISLIIVFTHASHTEAVWVFLYILYIFSVAGNTASLFALVKRHSSEKV